MRAALMALTVLATLALAGGDTTRAKAQESEPRNGAIERTIQSQIEAFLADDFARAFTFASPGIQGFFGTSERFGQMVRNGYPMVWRPADVRYLELRRIGGALWQKVLITDGAGRYHTLDYQMIEGADGWRINGVQLLPTPNVGA